MELSCEERKWTLALLEGDSVASNNLAGMSFFSLRRWGLLCFEGALYQVQQDGGGFGWMR